MKVSRRTTLAALAAAMILFTLCAAACSQDTDGEVTVAVYPSAVELTVGDDPRPVIATVTDGDVKDIVWISDDENIASIDTVETYGDSATSACYIIPVAKGRTTVRAVLGTAYAAVDVYVSVFDEITVLLGESHADVPLRLNVGESVSLTATSSLGSTDFTWTSDNESIFTVANGNVTAAAPGTATLTVSSGYGRTVMTVEVSAPISAQGYEMRRISLTDASAGTPELDDGIWYYAYGSVLDGAHAAITILQAYVENGTAALTFDGNTGEIFGVRLLYNEAGLDKGEHVLTCDIESTAAGTVTLNGSPVVLNEGSNTVTVRFTLTENSPSFDLMMGYGDTTVPSATVKIKNAVWTPAA